MSYLQYWLDEVPNMDSKLLYSLLELAEQEDINPDFESILRAFDFFPPADTRVIILGEEPDTEQADGLAYSNEFTDTSKNILTEVELDCGGAPAKGDLSGWAEQGVLLLNRTLTVSRGLHQSHFDHGWHIITHHVIKHLSNSKEDTVYILWGDHIKMHQHIRTRRNLVLQSKGPYSDVSDQGFFGSRPFTKANTYLVDKGYDPIDWTK